MFTYPSFKDPNNGTATIDVLFTVTASARPFADGLFLTNQAHLTEGTTNASAITQDAIVQIRMTEPVLNVTKSARGLNDPHATLSGPTGPVSLAGLVRSSASGLISSSALEASPLDSDINGVQAGDLVTFAVIENMGTGLYGRPTSRSTTRSRPGSRSPPAGLNLRVIGTARGRCWATPTSENSGLPSQRPPAQQLRRRGGDYGLRR
ncbi:MAG: hypothetical protein U0835_20705 [Isosphaeraceae bacterium]